MRFYVLSKCIDEEHGDIIINLDTNTLERTELEENLEEDKTYIYANHELIQIKNIDWNLKDTYMMAFQKNNKIKNKDFHFVKISPKDEVVLDDNFFLYKNGSLLGRITNKNEIHMIEKEGLEKTRRIIHKIIQEGAAILTRGKKVYRIFSYTKLNTLNQESQKQISLEQYLKEEEQLRTKNRMINIQKDVKDAYDRLESALKLLQKEIED